MTAAAARGENQQRHTQGERTQQTTALYQELHPVLSFE
jgi:hypothetical protein